MKSQVRRQRVLLVRSNETADGEDITCSMMSLLKKFGPCPPLPTAIFPCDRSTRSSAISEMAWRMRRASTILENASTDLSGDEINGIVHRVASVFLCAGVMVLTRPDTLPLQDQDVLLAGIGGLNELFMYSAA